MKKKAFQKKVLANQEKILQQLEDFLKAKEVIQEALKAIFHVMAVDFLREFLGIVEEGKLMQRELTFGEWTIKQTDEFFYATNGEGIMKFQFSGSEIVENSESPMSFQEWKSFLIVIRTSE